ncbi:MAG: hypothetical protein MZV70_50945 [Desulfobacterales bacterium]|nr:hypothetical protein [Desulfobacterales bacterium]
MIVDAVKAGAADFVTTPLRRREAEALGPPGARKPQPQKRDRLPAPRAGRGLRHRPHHFGQPGHAEGHGAASGGWPRPNPPS